MAVMAGDAGADTVSGRDGARRVLGPFGRISILEERNDGDVFCWRAAAGHWSVHRGETCRARVRARRDYGMFDRREAPQYYPAVKRQRSGA